MIIIIAPYCPEDKRFLGSSRKVELIIKSFALIGSPIVLVNSVIKLGCSKNIRVTKVTVGGVDVTQVSIENHKLGYVNKLFSFTKIQKIIDIIKKIGVPQYMWFYNGYAFEMEFARIAGKQFCAKMILGFEDWHFARRRGGNPKPVLDYICWQLSAGTFHHTFAANEFLAQKMRRFKRKVDLLPGIIDPAVSALALQTPPFQTSEKKITVGYFGGLNSEKGADLVLGLIDKSSDRINFIVTGNGDLSNDFTRRSNADPRKLNYFGTTTSDLLANLILKCDVILNPHTQGSQITSGVFPFKVMEAIASGRLVVSTGLMRNGLTSELAGVQFCDKEVNSFLKIIEMSREIYLIEKSAISISQRLVSDRFGCANLKRMITE